MLERPAKDKHSSLLQAFVTYGRKKVLWNRHLDVTDAPSVGVGRVDLQVDAFVRFEAENILIIQSISIPGAG